ncbi:MAG: pallilysin-related adhesin [Treponema sp.]|nr:pallilysin-related adhesin [Treponema sp.]MCL2237958.1 pallilysin-related adhesin [Treponema sp.]
MKKELLGLYIGIAAFSVLLIIFLATGLWKRFFIPEEDENVRTRIVTPREAGAYSSAEQGDFVYLEENLSTKVPMQEGENVIAVLNRESESGIMEEQFVLYRNSNDASGPVYIAFIGFDTGTREYKRMWNLPAAASRAETATLFSQDLIGDRNNCIIVTGMNANNEHTMTIFRPATNQSIQEPYKKIAELQIAGSIIVQEVTRSSAYQQGMTRGQSFNIAAYGQDSSSANIMDQIETIYSFNPSREQYEQINVSRIPGTQIEQRRLRELLSGTPGVFENFINDLWYYVSPMGTVDTSQYLYFDPAGKEIIFFGDESQQVFRWQSANYTRYGLFIRSQNISISTLLRFIDIELRSLDRIELRVIEDVRLKIAVSTPWDGSYRRAGSVNIGETVSQIRPAFNSVFDSSWGRIQFNTAGEYTISSGGNTRRGRYVFYKVDGNELLELRPEGGSDNRLVYKTENAAGVMILSRVRVGTTGVHDLLEPAVTLTPVQ